MFKFGHMLIAFAYSWDQLRVSYACKIGMDELTESQERCLLLIDRYIEEHGHSPTRQELSELLGQKSTNGVNQILEALQKKGYIKLEPPRRKRNIVILRRSHRQMELFDDGGEA